VETGQIAFCRVAQLSFLRLLTTAAAMGGKLLAIAEVWPIFDRFFAEDRVHLAAAPEHAERRCDGFVAAGDRGGWGAGETAEGVGVGAR
jgi:hypothetical protein